MTNQIDPEPTGDVAPPNPPVGATPAPPADQAPAPESADAGATPPDMPLGDPAARRRRRRRTGLLILLASLLGVFVLFTGWYLINRKPITELPLPGVDVEDLPTYAFSLYGVNAPTGVAVTGDGSRIYVTQTEGDPDVLLLDRSGRQLATIKPPATATGDHVPVYLALEPRTGDLYVSDRPAGAIYVYSADGLFRRQFDPGPTLTGWQPLGMAFDPEGDLWVTDVSGPFNSVHKFGPDGTLLTTIGSEGQFNFPNGVTIDANRYVYVTDSNNGRLVIFDEAGTQVAVIRRGSAAGDLGLPRGTVVDDSGRVYVVDTTGQGVQVYHTLGQDDRSPRYIGRFGAQGSTDGTFQYPNGVAVDGRARVYVTDWRNNRVQVWTY